MSRILCLSSDQLERKFFTKQTDTSNFQMFWDKCLYDGVYEVDAEVPSYALIMLFTAAAASIAQNYKPVGMDWS